LAVAEFAPGSQLRVIGPDAFHRCQALLSFCVPSSVESIAHGCFSSCISLTEFRFEPISNIRVLSVALFLGSQIKSFCVPASVEVIEPIVFRGCSLTSLTFESPSRLREVWSLPWGGCEGPIDMPDSVGHFSCDLITDGRGSLFVRFGRNSRLMWMKLEWGKRDYYRRHQRRGFVQFAEHSLKGYRNFVEFWNGDPPRELEWVDRSGIMLRY
jgi:hypothetical protein